MAFVRAKRLVFTLRVDLPGPHQELLADSGYGQYSVLIQHKGWRGPGHRGTTFYDHDFESLTTEQAVERHIAAAQADFDRRWLADTEIVPLEWDLIDENCWKAYCIGRSPYYVWDFGTYARYSLGVIHVSRDSQATSTLDAAKSACESHHRKLLLGTDE